MIRLFIDSTDSCYTAISLYFIPDIKKYPAFCMHIQEGFNYYQ